MIRLIVKYIKKYIPGVILVIAATLIQASVQLFFLVQETKNILDKGVAVSDMNYIWHSGARMMFYTLIIGLCTILTAYLGASISGGLRKDMCRDCYTKVLAMTPQDFARFGESTLFTRCMTDTNEIQRITGYVLRNCVLAPMIIVLMLISLFTQNKQMFTIEVVSFGITILIMLFLEVKSKPNFIRLQEKIDHLNLLTKEKITGVRTIRAFGNQKLEEERTAKVNKEACDADIKANFSLKFMMPSTMIVMNWAIVLIYFIGSNQVKQGMTQVSSLLLVIQYTNYLISSLVMIPILINMIPRSNVASRRILELLDYEIAKPDSTIEKVDMKLAGKLEFRDVSFGYNGAQDVISHATFTIEPGQKTAIIGATGSGKSTLLCLMLGFYQPNSGKILLNNVPMDDIDREERLKYFSYASQKAMVFQDTVKENLRTYHEEITENQILDACDAAVFTEVLGKMEAGIDTVMAQGGMNISGGQRKRLTLARTLAKDAEIYLLDDPFAALDARTESTARQNTMEYLKGKTIVMVAQRISTITDADQIIVLKNGKIVGIGTHETLQKECQEYMDIYHTQCYLEREK